METNISADSQASIDTSSADISQEFEAPEATSTPWKESQENSNSNSNKMEQNELENSEVEEEEKEFTAEKPDEQEIDHSFSQKWKPPKVDENVFFPAELVFIHILFVLIFVKSIHKKSNNFPPIVPISKNILRQ